MKKPRCGLLCLKAYCSKKPKHKGNCRSGFDARATRMETTLRKVKKLIHEAGDETSSVMQRDILDEALSLVAKALKGGA